MVKLKKMECQRLTEVKINEAKAEELFHYNLKKYGGSFTIDKIIMMSMIEFAEISKKS